MRTPTPARNAEPETFLHRRQWHNSNGPTTRSISKRTPPHKQLPVIMTTRSLILAGFGDISSLMPAALAEFHPAVRSWFERRFDAPSRAQELGWPVIGAANTAPGYDVLLCAPTGSGKTLAAFMWAINGLVLEAERGILRDEVSVLYVSPLKALANDIRLNLEEPLNGVRDLGAESGLDLSH